MKKQTKLDKFMRNPDHWRERREVLRKITDKEVIIWSPEFTGGDVLNFFNNAGFVENADFRTGKKKDKVYILPLRRLYLGGDAKRFNFQTKMLSEL